MSRKKEIFLDLVINLTIVIALAIFIRMFIIEPFNVEGSSMCDTLNYIDGECMHKKERIIVNKLAYKAFGLTHSTPERGDIIVFVPPQGRDEAYIKRVIALPGETVKLNDGEVIIINEQYPDGKVLEEPYLNAKNRHHTFAMKNKRIFSLKEGDYFVMGDNRAASTDSRACFRLTADCQPGDKHFISMDDIKGKAWVSLWPLSKIRWLDDVDFYN